MTTEAATEAAIEAPAPELAVYRVQTVTELSRLLADKPNLKVWGYCRVSSEKQEEGQSLATQESAIIEYAKSNGIREIGLVLETASAAKPCFSISISDAKGESQRPLFSLLVAKLTAIDKSSSVETLLIVWKLDRLSRVLHEQEFLIEIFNRRKVKLVSLQSSEAGLLSGTAADDPGRALLRQIFGAFAQYERALIKLRISSGTKTKASKGGWIGGMVPFGYRIEKHDLAIKPDEAEIVRQIFKMRDVEMQSFEGIARHLNMQHKTSYWYRMRVRRVIDNRLLYAGVYEDPYGVRHDRPDLRILPAEWDENGFLAVTRDFFRNHGGMV